MAVALAAADPAVGLAQYPSEPPCGSAIVVVGASEAAWLADVSQLLVTRDGHGTPRNDGHGSVETLGDSVMTGPPLTSVNDFRAIMIVRTIVVD